MTAADAQTTKPKDFQAMRDIADGLIEAAGGEPLGRVADIELTGDENGRYRCTAFVIGPEALAGRVGTPLRGWLHWLLHGRFEYTVDIDEVEEFGPTLKLRHPANHYQVGHADQWVIDHLLRFIPGHGPMS